MSETPAAPPPNPIAIASLVSGVAAVLTSCCCYGFPFNILGLVLGVVAIVQANGDPNMAGGKNLAFAGIGASVFSFLVAVGMVVFGFGMGLLSSVLQNM